MGRVKDDRMRRDTLQNEIDRLKADYRQRAGALPDGAVVELAEYIVEHGIDLDDSKRIELSNLVTGYRENVRAAKARRIAQAMNALGIPVPDALARKLVSIEGTANA